MAIRKSFAALGRIAIAYPSIAAHVVAQRFAFTVPANIPQGDIIELAPIPPHCRVVDIVLDSAKLDTNGAAAIAVDVGIMSGNWGDDDPDRTVGAEFFAASDVAQAGGVARPTLASAYKQGASDVARSIGVKIATAAATGAAGEIGLTVHYATA